MTQPAPNPLWSHALELYQRPGARQACLVLQDRAGVDVTLLLACLWLARRGTPPRATETVWPQLLQQTSVLRLSVIGPVREARRHMKPVVEALPPALREPAASLRAGLSESELSLEHLLVEMLFDGLRSLPVAQAPSSALDHVHGYCLAAGLSLDAGAQAALTRLIRIAA